MSVWTARRYDDRECGEGGGASVLVNLAPRSFREPGGLASPVPSLFQKPESSGPRPRFDAQKSIARFAESLLCETEATATAPVSNRQAPPSAGDDRRRLLARRGSLSALHVGSGQTARQQLDTEPDNRRRQLVRRGSLILNRSQSSRQLDTEPGSRRRQLVRRGSLVLGNRQSAPAQHQQPPDNAEPGSRRRQMVKRGSLLLNTARSARRSNNAAIHDQSPKTAMATAMAEVTMAEEERHNFESLQQTLKDLDVKTNAGIRELFARHIDDSDLLGPAEHPKMVELQNMARRASGDGRGDDPPLSPAEGGSFSSSSSSSAFPHEPLSRRRSPRSPDAGAAPSLLQQREPSERRRHSANVDNGSHRSSSSLSGGSGRGEEISRFKSAVRRLSNSRVAAPPIPQAAQQQQHPPPPNVSRAGLMMRRASFRQVTGSLRLEHELV